MSMDMNALSQKSDSVSPPDCSSDPYEKEISDDDDDRNHKHRRPDSESQSVERDSVDQASTQPFRKRNRTIQNGQSDPQFQHNSNRDFSKRRLTGTNFARFSGQHGSGRGRGRDFQRDSWFGSIDGASQLAHPGSIPPPMFCGRGVPGPNAQSASWSGFGLVPTIPNGTIDAINPLGLPGILGPQMSPSMNMGMRQRCRDFEERGFCLRGDMCPMEHGVNRIVVEDVQSLSHFNLPLSLPSAQILGTSAGSGFVLPAGISNTLMNSRGPHNLMNMSSVDEEPLAGAIDASGADVYDPDQPLWNNDARETSSPLVELQQSNFDENVSCMDADLSDRVVRSSGDAIGGQSTSSSVWGRFRNSKNKLELKGKFEIRTNASDFPTKEICEPSSGTPGMTHVGKHTIGALSGSKTALSTSKLPNDVGGTIRKSSQKADRTLFVNCIPLKDNKRENLLSHFRKFGEVVDIYIPANSERAFIQFSKREEAEKALKAPDAVMGSRFIKLWWANRDNIAINGVTPPDVMAASGSTHISGINRVKDNVLYAAPKVVVPKPLESNVATGSVIKPVTVNSPRGVPPTQKKMESLGLLKEELRKKQEMLEQKRNEFRQQLDKLSKQTSGKSEVPAVPAKKSQISETSSNASKAGNTQPSEIVIMPSAEVDKITVENLAPQKAKAKSACALRDPPLKQSISAIATSGAPSHMNRYKLDNRPRTFRINAPLPERLINVSVLRDHFSSFGQISNLKIEDSGEEESRNVFTDSEEMTRNCSAQVSFATRQAAERAFLDGKSWHGHNLQFSWITSSIPPSNQLSGESSSVLKRTASIEVQSTEKTVNDDPKKTLDLKETNSSPPKSSNELSCDSSMSSLKSSLVEKNSASEVNSPDKLSFDKSTGNVPSEADEPENRGLERQEQESAGDHRRTG